MKHSTIKALLERYFEGDTDLKEEALLRQYFQNGEVPEELETYRPLFDFFVQEKEQQTSLRLNEVVPRPSLRVQHRSRRKSWAIAATIALLIGLGTIWLNQQTVSPPQTAAIDWSKYEPRTEAEALLLTKNALRRTTSALQRGLRNASTEIQQVQEILQPFK